MKLNIFLVEDNADTRTLMTMLLEGAGHDVRSAGTVEAALDGFPASGSTVLISDLGMPDGTGYELLRELKRRGETPFAIAISGYGTVKDLAQSSDAGFHHHLLKPIEFEQLERVLDEVSAAATCARPQD